MPTLPRRTAALGLSIGVLIAVAPAATGEAPDPQAVLGVSIESLDAPDFGTRDQASEDLNEALLRLRNGAGAHAWSEIERSLVRAASEGALTIEARVRLLACLKRQFFESPRAAIGIRFNQNPEQPREVRIQQVEPGFPAGDAGILRAGDVMVAIDGVPIVGTADFMNITRTMICSRDPGDIVKMTVVRQPEPDAALQTMTLDVPLGSFDQLIRPDLPRAQQIGAEALEAAWRVRLQRMGWAPDAELAVLPASLPADDWRRYERAPRAQGAPKIALAEAQPGADETGVFQLTKGAERLATGQRADGPDQLENLRIALGGERNAMRQLQPLVLNADDPDKQLLSLLQNQIAERLQVAAKYAQRLEHMDVPEAERVRLKAMHEAEMQAISQLQMQIRDITSQIKAQQIMRERRLKQPRP